MAGILAVAPSKAQGTHKNCPSQKKDMRFRDVPGPLGSWAEAGLGWAAWLGWAGLGWAGAGLALGVLGWAAGLAGSQAAAQALS